MKCKLEESYGYKCCAYDQMCKKEIAVWPRLKRMYQSRLSALKQRAYVPAR